MPKNPQILILVGAPGSGKSTFAQHFIRTEKNWMRLCRDDFRTMHFTNSNLSHHEEYLIAEMIDAATEALLLNRSNVLLDATHCRKEYINHYIDRFNHLADISFKVFDIDAATLAERCENRFRNTGKFIPAHIQKKFIEELEVLKKVFDFSPRPKINLRVPVSQQDINLPKAIVCDLDGTLSLIHGRSPFDATHCDEDELNEPVASVLRNFVNNNDYQILLVSGREDCYRQPTIRFLEKHTVPYHHLWMRKTKDLRKDAIIKKEIFDTKIADKYCVEFVLDNRNQVVDMWRKELHLPCFQVNYGNF